MSKRRPTILICDDSLLVRKKMKDCLSEYGDFDIVEASSGKAPSNCSGSMSRTLSSGYRDA